MLLFIGAALGLPAPTSNKALQATSAASTLPPIIPIAATTCAYRNSNLLPLLADSSQITAACDIMTAAGWTLAESYNVLDPTTADTDNLDLHTSGGDCLLAFHGDDLSEAGLIAYVYNGTGQFFSPVTYYGVPGVMGILSDETETLLRVVRTRHGTLATWMSQCTGSLAVTGHSSGGAIGGLIAYLANLPTDPLGLGKTVDEVYMYGTGTYTLSPLTNALTSDGCFGGAYYYMQVPDGVDPTYGSYADMTRSTYWGAFGFTAQPMLSSTGLLMTAAATVASAQTGPAASSTACGASPPVFTAMANNATLLNRAASQRLIALGGTYGTHEPVAYLHSFQ